MIQSSPANITNLFLGSPMEALQGSMTIKMKTNKYYTTGALLQTNNNYVVTRAWGKLAVESGWATDLSAQLPDDPNPKIGGVYAPIFQGLWANRPPASTSAGKTMLITDLPQGGLTHFYSDGTNWYLVGGQASIAALSGTITAPVAQAANTATALIALPGGGIKIPAGLLVPGRSVLRVSAYINKIGSAAGIPVCAYFGKNNAFTDFQYVQQFIGPGANAVFWIFTEISFSSTTLAQCQFQAAPLGVPGVVATAESTGGQIDTTVDQFFNFGYNSSTLPDGLSLVKLNIQLFQ